MKCSKDKCKSLHLWRKSPVQPHSLGTDGMGSISAGKAMGVRGDSRLSMSQQCALAAKQAKSILGCIGSRSREVIIHLYPTLITLHLEYGVLFCPPPPQHRKDIDKGEGVQQRITRTVGTWALTLWGGAEEPGLVQPGEEEASWAPNSNPSATMGWLQKTHCQARHSTMGRWELMGISGIRKGGDWI